MPHIPEGPLIERLKWVSKTGCDNFGHPFFPSQWREICHEAVVEIERLRSAIKDAIETLDDASVRGDDPLLERLRTAYQQTLTTESGK